VSEQASLYVVITDFDGWEQTETCLRRLDSSEYQDFRTIVVDHGTSDETARGLAAFPSCVRVAAESDVWWTGATNVGIRAAQEMGASHIMLLNNDCYVDASTIGTLMNHVVATGAPVVAPLQRSTQGDEILVATAATCFTLGFPTFVSPSMKKVDQDGDDLVSTKMIIGGRGVVIANSLFDEIGLFDEAALPHYGADHDFYMRCRAVNTDLLIATDASVRIDETRTTLAKDLGAMTLRQFMASFQDPRSHRNFATLVTLFKRYYPVRLLFFVGVFLNVTRYVLSYAGSRAMHFAMMPFR
jgi:GT2 family glycosyltransferase